MTATPFATELRRQRERVGLSQSQLAALAGYDSAYLSRLEAGKRAPSRETVMALCGALGLDNQQAGRLLLAGGYWPALPGWWATYEQTTTNGQVELVLQVNHAHDKTGG